LAKTKLSKRGVNSERLTDKQRVFCYEYLIDYNGTRAARVAGYKQPATAASKLLNPKLYPLVAKMLGKAQKDNLEQLELTREKVLEELACIAFRDVKDLCNKEGFIDVDHLGLLPKRIRVCIDSIDQQEFLDPETGEVSNRKTKITMVPKAAAIALAMKHFGMLAPQEVSVKHSVDWDSFFNLSMEEPDIPNLVNKALGLEE